jgi:hypothetical protein
LISLIKIHLLSETIVSGRGQKHAGGAIIGGQGKKCRKVITLQQKLNVLKWHENNEKCDTVHIISLNKTTL